jgi:cytochrome b subunit of formate dehydrogenase
MEQELLAFPFWLRINHFINLFCIFLLMRSGVQILAENSTGTMTPRLGANG